MDLGKIATGLTPAFLIALWDQAKDRGAPHHLTGNRSQDIRMPEVRYVCDQSRRLPFPKDPGVLAGRFLFGVVVYQPFRDCNHRTGFLGLVAVMDEAGYELSVPEEEASELILGIRDIPMDEEERVIRWVQRSFRRA